MRGPCWNGHVTSPSPARRPPARPGLLDGGDVLQIADHMIVGLSARTNMAAVDQLCRILLGPGGGSGGGGPGARAGAIRHVNAVAVPHGLHLKSACSALDATTLLVSDDAAGHAAAGAVLGQLPALAGRLRVAVLPGDPLAANVLALGRDVVMQDAGHAAERALRALCGARGLALHVLPRMSELAKADGALTCCSILLA
jgi:dimethylargininase